MKNTNTLDLKILTYIYGEDFVLGKALNSCFRDDGTPSLVLYCNEQGTFSYYDFGNRSKSKKFDILELLSLTLEYTYKRPYSRLETRLFAQKQLHNLKVPSPDVVVKKRVKAAKPTIICKNYFDPYEIKYWSDYEQTPDILSKEGIYPVHEFFYHEKFKFTSDPIEPKFCYHLENGGWKYYCPNSDTMKWRSGNLTDSIELYPTLPATADELWIDSGTKDGLCMKLNEDAVIAPTSEGSFRVLLSRKEELESRFPKINVCLDADEAGFKYTKMLCDKTGWNPVYLRNMPYNPEKVRPCKDKAEVVKHYNSKELRLIIKNHKS